MIEEIGGIERRVGHDENARIDQPAHVEGGVEVFMDGGTRSLFSEH